MAVPMHGLLLSLALLAPLGQEEAVVHWNAGRRTQAIEAWSAQLQAAPQDAVLRRRLAEAQLEVHAYSAALETLAPLGPEVSALRGMAYYRSSRFEEAIDQLDPGVPEQLIMRIECLDALGRSSEVAADVERAAQLLGADHPRVLVYRARALAGADRHAEAVELFERARKLDPFDPG